ncbi:hypothetical protein E7744_00600 [Citricoccus sp. SGAir0253]|uniref:hypothetical protein n=1 Tax=Citricoccus sp. SGAir0253 TaxID=2567881 RepID=UPI0010CD581F|nr:hypothetical protein [Citricoccus sp. SGAir0253]QCU76896.1 hypothetical protein E7744_00600 [Citricoccus sp. SGAir0253]
MEYQSELRVYQPLAAFPDAVQAGLLRARHRTRAETEEEAARRAWIRLLRDVTDPFPHGEDLVRVLRVPVAGTGAPGEGPSSGGPGSGAGPAYSEYFCPDEMALRCELAAGQLAESMRPPTFGLLVPEAARQANVERLAARMDVEDLEEIRHVHTRTAVWGVPAAWFALVHEDDAIEIGTDGPAPEGPGGRFDAGSVRSVRITVPLALALERARRAAVVLSLHAPDMDLLGDLTILVSWLESFHPDSVVELDYGGLARLVWPDDSPFDVHTALEALEEGDTDAAVVANHRMVRRWLPVRQLGRAS